MRKSLPDACDICQKQFPHNSKTFGGIARVGQTVLVGECCQTKMRRIYVSGVYVSKNFEHLVPLSKGNVSSSSQAETDVNSAIDAIQAHFKSIDDRVEKVAQNAGISSSSPSVSLSDSPWKADDAAWFKSHPERSHRMRVMFENEFDSARSNKVVMQAVENHRVEVLVRQVEIGQRVRIPFARNLSFPIPDVEEVVHALFDLVTRPGREGVLSFAEVAALAEMYGSSFTGKPS